MNLSCVLLPAMTLLFVVGSTQQQDVVCKKPKKEAWQSDYKLFATTFAKAVRNSNPKAPFNEFNDLFAKKQIRWTMKFKGTQKDKDGLLLSFDGVPQATKFLSSKADEKNWQNYKSGSSVIVEANCKIAFVFTLNPGTEQEQKIGSIIFEETKLADEPKK